MITPKDEGLARDCERTLTAEDRFRRVAGYSAVAGLACYMVIMFAIFQLDNGANHGDFIQYWAAGQQLAHGANPYDLTAVLQIEEAAGFKQKVPLISISPPTLLVFLLPLGFLSSRVAVITWSLLLFISLSVSLRILWILHGRPSEHLEWCGYLFAPVLACFLAGQLGVFFLLGFVLFVYLHESSPYFAGAALLPCTFKPQLFLPFAIVLLLWSVNRKRYSIISGFLTVLIISCVFPLFFDTHVWSQYSQMMSAFGVLHHFIPTLSSAFRFLIDREAVWLQFLPEVGACVWAIWYFLRQRARWNWMDQGLLLLLISVLCAPYAWFVDETVLLPAVLAGAYRAMLSRRSLLPMGLVGAIALVELLVFPRMHSVFYLWTVPAWLGCYLYGSWGKPNQVGANLEHEMGSAAC